jgi:hypothetical protein
LSTLHPPGALVRAFFLLPGTRKRLAAAFSLEKTPMDDETPH